MLKLYNLAITKPLSIIYQNCLQQGVFPDDWKKGNIFLVHKKNSKQIVNNYQPVSHLPICSKIFEKLIFDSIHEFISKSNHFNNNQSGFRPNNSSIHQLIAITHDILSAFDTTRYWKFDLSKAFDRVCGTIISFINSGVIELMVTYLNLLNHF